LKVRELSNALIDTRAVGAQMQPIALAVNVVLSEDRQLAFKLKVAIFK
jgi:hypothetical protein